MLVREVSLGSSALWMVLWVSTPPRPEVPTVALSTLFCLTICQDLYPKNLGESHLLTNFSSPGYYNGFISAKAGAINLDTWYGPTQNDLCL